MSKTDYQKLEKALKNLKEQYENYLTIDEQGLSEVNKKAVKNSVIKCFEICYDTLVKHLKKFMEEHLGMPEVKDFAIEIFRKAKSGGVINEDMQKLLHKYRKIRNNSAHAYSEEEAGKTLNIIEDFIEDVSEIYQAMVDSE